MWESVDLPEAAGVRNENPYNVCMLFDVSVSHVTLIRNFSKNIIVLEFTLQENIKNELSIL